MPPTSRPSSFTTRATDGVREIRNLLVDLDERYDASARMRALQQLARAGYEIDERFGADDRTLAWIDERFGGSWSGEAYVARNAIASRAGVPLGFASYAPAGLRFAWLRGVATQPGVGIFGPFGVEPSERGGVLGPSLLLLALCALRTQGCTHALIAAVGDERLARYYARTVNAREVERFDLHGLMPQAVRTVLMASGNGSTVQSVIDRVAARELPLDLIALVVNDPGAYVIERARTAQIPIAVCTWNRATMSRADYDAKLRELVADERPALVLLLGWMHLLNTEFVNAFPEMINLHPAYLPLDPSRDDVGMPDGSSIPAFRGAHAVRDALSAKSAWVGASVHRVTAQTDRGPILTRVPLRVLEGEDENAVRERLRPFEHLLVERAVRRWCFERSPNPAS